MNVVHPCTDFHGLGGNELRFSAEKFPGLLVVAEGASCSGKSVFLGALAERFPAHLAVEWNSHPSVRPVVDELKANRSLSPVGHLLAGLLDHRIILDTQVLPALRAGELVLSDRYLYTAIVRDGLRGVPVEAIAALATLYPAPAAVYYFEIDREERLARYRRRRSSYGHYAFGRDILPGLDADAAFAEYTDRQVAVYRELGRSNDFVLDTQLAHAEKLITAWRDGV
jgi:dTMP kinase